MTTTEPENGWLTKHYPLSNERTITLTFTPDQMVILADVLYEALHSATADDDERAAYFELRDEIKRQWGEQRG